MQKIFIFSLTMLSIFSSCKEKEIEIDKCSNGFLDPGETGIDCGGICTPCIVTYPESIYMEFNGIPISINSKSLSYQNNVWTLNANNDSLNFQFNLGSDGNIGTYTMDPNGCIASKNGVFYITEQNGVSSFSMHDIQTQRMSGFFQADFTGTGLPDTLRIRNGQFSNLTY